MSGFNCEKAKALLDALFYGSYRPIHINQIKRLLGLKSIREVRDFLDRYIHEFNDFHKGVKIVAKDDHYYLTICEEYINKVKRFLPNPPLSQRQMEVLAFVYTRGKVAASDLKRCFGTRIYSDIKRLCRLRLLRKERIKNKIYVSLRDEARLMIYAKRENTS